MCNFRFSKKNKQLGLQGLTENVWRTETTKKATERGFFSFHHIFTPHHSATEEGVKSFFSIPTLTVEAVTTNAKGCSTVDAIKYRVTLTPANANTIGACLLGSAMPGCVGSGAFPAEFSQPVEVVQAFVCLEIYTTYEEEYVTDFFIIMM